MRKKILLACLFAGMIALFFGLGADQYLTLDYFSLQKERILAFEASRPFLSALLFCLVYILVTGLSLPGAAVMTLAGGAVFGLLEGTLLVSFSSTIGATIAFLVSRLLLRDWVQTRFGDSLRAVNEGIRKEGNFYLFGLRLVPVFPFFVINLVMGLTPMKARPFFFVSQLGMLPGTIVYVNAGTQLGQVTSLSGILSPALLFSFVLLGLFPLIARRGMDAWKKHRSR